MVGTWVGVLLVLVAAGRASYKQPYSYQFVRRDYEQRFIEDEGNFGFGLMEMEMIR